METAEPSGVQVCQTVWEVSKFESSLAFSRPEMGQRGEMFDVPSGSKIEIHIEFGEVWWKLGPGGGRNGRTKSNSQNLQLARQ